MICQTYLSGYGKPSVTVNSNPMKADGYTRSGLHKFLVEGYNQELELQRIQREELERVKKSDPARFVNICDPNGTQSTSK